MPATLSVNQAGTDGAFASIQAAVNAANPGDTIQVAAGLYQEHVVVNKSLTLNGAEAGVLAYGQRNGESTVDGTASGGAFDITASNVTINGFEVINGSTGANAGFNVHSDVSNVSILDNVIQNNTIGIFLNGTNIFVHGNLIENNNLPGASGGSGIYSDGGSANVTISDNRFVNNLNGAITFALLPSTIRANVADPLRNQNLLITRNSFYDVNLGSFADLTNARITENFVVATDQFSNIGIQGGVIGLTISNNELYGGTRGVRIVTPSNAFDPTPNQGITISTGNQFGGHSVAAIEVETGSVLGSLNATRNFWGALTGPTTDSNPSGTGEDLIDPDGVVDFSRFASLPHYITDKTGVFENLTANQKFVQELYLDVLGRVGDLSELNYWVGVQSQFGLSRQNLAASIESSFEARDLLVKSWYTNYLGRTAINGEERYWVNLLVNDHLTEENVLSQILASDEFYNHAQLVVSSGTPDQRYVTELYRALLGRTPNESELANGVTQLGNVGRRALVANFLASAEYRSRTFENDYNVLLHRAADSGGLDFWVNSSADSYFVRIAIEGSDEYFARASNE